MHNALLKRMAAAVLAVGIGTPAIAEMPSTIAVTTYSTTSAGFAQMVAIGGVLQSELGVNLRPIPGDNDISRQAPLQQGVAQFSSTGFGVFYSQEGVFEFADRGQWGPQPVRLVMSNVSDGGIGFAIDPALGVTDPSEMEGVRVARIVGSPALNLLVEAYLAFGGLTWDDVEVVEFPGFGAWLDGYVAGQVDAGIAVSDSGTSGRLAASNRGMDWVLFPTDDAEGWERITEFAPWFFPKTVTAGNNVPEDGLPFAVYHYPNLVTYAEAEEQMVYEFTRAMVEFFPQYEDAAPGAYGWAAERQSLSYVMPFHDGAIRYWQEAGMWTDADQANHDELLRRQQVLADTWAAVIAEDHADDGAFAAAWQAARFEALSEAGFNPFFETW
jgi:TRAP transporter TAXI family solute receptor